MIIEAVGRIAVLALMAWVVASPDRLASPTRAALSAGITGAARGGTTALAARWRAAAPQRSATGQRVDAWTRGNGRAGRLARPFWLAGRAGYRAARQGTAMALRCGGHAARSGYQAGAAAWRDRREQHAQARQNGQHVPWWGWTVAGWFPARPGTTTPQDQPDDAVETLIVDPPGAPEQPSPEPSPPSPPEPSPPSPPAAGDGPTRGWVDAGGGWITRIPGEAYQQYCPRCGHLFNVDDDAHLDADGRANVGLTCPRCRTSSVHYWTWDPPQDLDDEDPDDQSEEDNPMRSYTADTTGPTTVPSQPGHGTTQGPAGNMTGDLDVSQLRSEVQRIQQLAAALSEAVTAFKPPTTGQLTDALGFYPGPDAHQSLVALEEATPDLAGFTRYAEAADAALRQVDSVIAAGDALASKGVQGHTTKVLAS